MVKQVMALQKRFSLVSLVMLFVFGVSFSVCKNDESKTKNIVGNWKLLSGQRNSLEQNSLEGIIFNFSSDSLTTNFNVSGSLETYPYKLKNKKIMQLGKNKLTYQINEQSDSMLTLYTELRGSDFRLTLTKQ